MNMAPTLVASRTALLPRGDRCACGPCLYGTALSSTKTTFLQHEYTRALQL